MIDRTTLLKSTACDIFVAPARMENLANTCLEAVASGLPVVSFDVGGMRDLIEDNVNGFLTNRYDTKQFASNILAALEGRERYRIVSRRIAESRFCESKAVLKIQEIGLNNG